MLTHWSRFGLTNISAVFRVLVEIAQPIGGLASLPNQLIPVPVTLNSMHRPRRAALCSSCTRDRRCLRFVLLQLLLDDNTFPESDSAFDIQRRFFRVRIIPGRAFINRAVNADVVI